MRLLYLAYAFPPSPAIGSIRSWNTAKWLAALGWSVSVVTPEASTWRDAEEPRPLPPGVELIPTGHGLRMLAPDHVLWAEGDVGTLVRRACRAAGRRLGLESTVGWEASAWRACAQVKPGEFDLILATASPFVSFRLARELGRRLDCPFVMDYRDPWTGNPHKVRGDPREEARLLRDCAGATVVSPSWAKLIGGAFDVVEKIHVVSNGFDPDMFAGVARERFDHFAVVYAGTLYPPKRALDPVLRAFRAFRESASGAKFHYYGDHGEPLRRAAAEACVSDDVIVHGRVPRKAALQAQKGADMLVVVASVEEEGSLADKGVVTGKVFDCMALDRPTLLVAPRGSDLYEIARTAGGMRCFTGSDVSGMAHYMSEIAEGKAPPRADCLAYRWDHLARKLDAVLRSAAA